MVDIYARRGFFLKAVAIAKQVCRLDPKMTVPLERLGDLHERLQLRSEAIAYYQLALGHHRAVGNAVGVLRVVEVLGRLEGRPLGLPN